MSYEQTNQTDAATEASGPAAEATAAIRDDLRRTEGFDAQAALLAAIPGASLVQAARDWWNGDGGTTQAPANAPSEVPPEVQAAVVTAAGGDQAAAAAPDADSTTATATDEGASDANDPLKGALDKVGEVKYKDERFLKGSGNLSKAETDKLIAGDDDIVYANCSTFATWMLANAGLDVTSRAANGGRRLNDYINICVPLETGSLKGDVDGRKDPIKGAAAGFVVHGVGYEVGANSEVKPGDFIQTWSSKPGGHSQMVHRAHCSGAAVFGLPGSPVPIGFEPPVGGGVMGLDGPVNFKLDENTDPALVGAHTVSKVELLGCHLAGTDADGNKNAPGVYTKAAHGFDNYYRFFAGRLNDSKWANFSPADVANFKPDEQAPADGGGAGTPDAAPQPGDDAGGGGGGWGDALESVYDGLVEGARDVSDWLFGGGDQQLEQADPATAPTETAPAAPEQQPFNAPDVKGCDYVVHPDGKIVFWRDGEATREFPADHQLHPALKAEILQVYPNMPY